MFQKILQKTKLNEDKKTEAQSRRDDEIGISKGEQKTKRETNSFLLIPIACNSKIRQTEWPETQQSYYIIITEA